MIERTDCNTPWVSWDYWTNQYQGAALSIEEFTRLEAAAQRYVDKQTFGRICPEELTTDIQNAVCAVIEAIQTNEQGGVIASESIGKYSVSYLSGAAKTDGQRLRDSMLLYLGHTGLACRSIAAACGFSCDG